MKYQVAPIPEVDIEFLVDIKDFESSPPEQEEETTVQKNQEPEKTKDDYGAGKMKNAYRVYFHKKNRTEQKQPCKVGKTDIFKQVYISGHDNSQLVHPLDLLKQQSQRR